MKMKTNVKFSERFIRGGFSALISAMALAIVVAVNLVANAIPSNLTKFDVSSSKYYTFSNQTKEITAALDDDITIYFLTETTNRDEVTMEFLRRYAQLSERISLEVIDMVLYPNFSKQYTDMPPDPNSVIVAGPYNSKVVGASDIYLLNYALYLFNGSLEYDFDADGQITSAILHVTNKNPGKAYNLTGHGETELPYGIQAMLEKENLEISSLNLLRDGAIPGDADSLIAISPKTDFNDVETGEILDYLRDGGNMLFITDYTEDLRPNLDAILEYKGLQLVEGLVFEGDVNRSIGDHNNYLLPLLQYHDITLPIISNSLNFVIPNAQAIKEIPVRRSSLDMLPLLASSASAYSKVAGYRLTTRDKEEGDIDGPFILGILVTENNSGGDSKFIWYGSSMFLDEAIDKQTAGANTSLFISSLAFISGQDSNLGIHPKSLRTANIVVSTSQSRMWGIILMIVLPAAVMTAGFIVWLRRRKK